MRSVQAHLTSFCPLAVSSSTAHSIIINNNTVCDTISPQTDTDTHRAGDSCWVHTENITLEITHIQIRSVVKLLRNQSHLQYMCVNNDSSDIHWIRILPVISNTSDIAHGQIQQVWDQRMDASKPTKELLKMSFFRKIIIKSLMVKGTCATQHGNKYKTHSNQLIKNGFVNVKIF